MGFALSTDEVVALLLTMHAVEPGKEVAFRARLKHFQRLGFPAGINTGRGRAAVYGPEQFLFLLLGVELLALGLPPERAVRAIDDHRDHVLRNLKQAVLSSPGTRRRGEEQFIYMDPQGLAALQRQAPGSASDAVTEYLFFGAGRELSTFFKAARLVGISTGLRSRSRIAVVDLRGMLSAAASAALITRVVSAKDMARTLTKWAQDGKK